MRLVSEFQPLETEDTNSADAQRVRAIFDLYQDYRSPMAAVREVNRRGWTTKR